MESFQIEFWIDFLVVLKAIVLFIFSFNQTRFQTITIWASTGWQLSVLCIQSFLNKPQVFGNWPITSSETIFPSEAGGDCIGNNVGSILWAAQTHGLKIENNPSTKRTREEFSLFASTRIKLGRSKGHPRS